MKDYLDVLNKRLNEEIKIAKENLGEGSAKDFEDYRFQCGKIHGLLLAQREILDLQQRLKDQE